MVVPNVLKTYSLESLKEKPSDDQIAILKAATKTDIKDSESLLYAIAKLGGHIKYNGPPGWQVLHRGMKQLYNLHPSSKDNSCTIFKISARHWEHYTECLAKGNCI